MNVPFLIDRSLAREPQKAQAGRGPVLLGMPHLALNGLSETWLLKELGHRHWLMLAQMAGRSVPDFRDPAGAPVYAAFRSAEISAAAFEKARENDILDIRSVLSRLSRTRTLSRHELRIGGEIIGLVTLTSVFVHRRSGSSNHSIARIEIADLPPFDPAIRPYRAPPVSSCNTAADYSRLKFTPCPSQDFNGAGFLYFTSFQAFADRAEWAMAPGLARGSLLEDRRIDYCGNIDPGESIEVTLSEPEIRDGTICFTCRVERSNDAILLASIRTTKRLSNTNTIS
ncbi:Pnap_2097 family protein [Labrys sp. ZIDIC5]|uniref:Pnap_2097 family protein n=1 Tax=Labrys sedimenti TaxID=3106036 RepID=UPI002ACA4D9B|nr:Pnap_2097 family protein [Labrys sp. ZIDIC5]MDZ5454712.1 Pnap_2097 family protein [Labrys sp. ZIDIC5]